MRGERFGRLFAEQLAGHAWGDGVQRAAVSVGDHGAAYGHRLDRRNAEIFQPRKDKRPAAAQQFQDAVLAAHEGDVGRGLGFEGLAVAAVPDDGLECSRGASQLGRCA